MNKDQYKETMSLLLEILPFALQDKRVALKGGTAINLFYQDFPRFSVDIDLCYLPVEDRDTTYVNLHKILSDIKTSLEANLSLRVSSSNPLDGKKESKLVASRNGIEVKIEPNFVLRSSLFKTQDLVLSKSAQDMFEKSVTARCLNIADTYGGKICAALDRQHPRDLFDVLQLMENEGITKEVKDSFLFYLLSHNRPINELLNPNLKDIQRIYELEFIDMTQVEVSLEHLIQARKELVFRINKALTEEDRCFLISFVSNNPDWSKARDRKIEHYPSIRWKLLNQKRMSPRKLENYIRDVEKLLKES